MIGGENIGEVYYFCANAVRFPTRTATGTSISAPYYSERN